MNWDADADDEGKAIIVRAARDLEVESERLAKHRHSTVVTKDHVVAASEYLNIGRVSTAMADIGLAIGVLFLGAAIGVGVTYVTTPTPAFPHWLDVVSVAVAALGILVIGYSVAAKIKAR